MQQIILKKKNEIKTYLQYIILKIPAKTRGKREIVPFLSSTLSIIKIAIIDVKATVICSNKCNNKVSLFQSSTLDIFTSREKKLISN
jgi:hypothetical protein